MSPISFERAVFESLVKILPSNDGWKPLFSIRGTSLERVLNYSKFKFSLRLDRIVVTSILTRLASKVECVTAVRPGSDSATDGCHSWPVFGVRSKFTI